MAARQWPIDWLIVALLSVLLQASVVWASDNEPLAAVHTPEIDAALQRAAERQLPVLVDFHAPWCYSCYYMSQRVLLGSRWQDIQRRAVVVPLDADSPEGTYWKRHWKVDALPAYVLLKPEAGRETVEYGRILGEQRADDFYRVLNRLLAKSSSLSDLQARAVKGGPSGLQAVREVLQMYRLRGDVSGLDWYHKLYGPLQQFYSTDPIVSRERDRLALLHAAGQQDAAACQQIAARVLATDLACERPYEIARLRSCVEALPATDRQPLLQQQILPMQQLVERRVFGKASACADERSAVLGLTQLYRELGRPAQADTLLRRAAGRLEAKIGAHLQRDRNAADNWRVYLEQLDDQSALDRLYPRLIQAYPDDYVYPFRYGRMLVERGDAEAALPYLQQAAPMAYGRNRLKVAEQRVAALRSLGRDAEARTVAGEALRANGPWFADDAARLKAAAMSGP